MQYRLLCKFASINHSGVLLLFNSPKPPIKILRNVTGYIAKCIFVAISLCFCELCIGLDTEFIPRDTGFVVDSLERSSDLSNSGEFKRQTASEIAI